MSVCVHAGSPLPGALKSFAVWGGHRPLRQIRRGTCFPVESGNSCDRTIPEPISETQRATSYILPREGGRDPDCLAKGGWVSPSCADPLCQWLTDSESLKLPHLRRLFPLSGTACPRAMWACVLPWPVRDSSAGVQCVGEQAGSSRPGLSVISCTLPQRRISGARAVFLRG